MNRESASNLTSWFAEQLDAQIDTSRDGEWYPVNESYLPEFLLVTEAYVLPLVDGTVEAQYLGAGILRNIELKGNTSYVAKSIEEGDLRKVADQIALDLGLNTSQSQLGIVFTVLFPGTSQEEYQWLIILEELTDFGLSYLASLNLQLRTQRLSPLNMQFLNTTLPIQLAHHQLSQCVTERVSFTRCM
jgi:hypothetical protein